MPWADMWIASRPRPSRALEEIDVQHRALIAAVAALALVPALAHGQQKTPRRQAPIEIRGQVPTPQVVTVRPREVPAYSRQVLVPRFYDHDFWPEIQEGYAIMSNR